MQLKLKMTLEKETKGAVRYAEDKPASGAEPAIGTLYIRKSALGGKIPQTIEVMVGSED
jgi:hypothetical protein